MQRLKFSIFIPLFFLFAHPVNAQVTALFSANDTAGCGSLIVQFTNQSTGSGTLTYKWDFGNGESSTLQNPLIIYQNPGIYTVQLITTNGTESDTLTRKQYLHIFNEPQALFSLQTEASGCQGSSFTFQNESVPGDTTINSYTWDFGDNTLEQTQSPSHSYSDAGTYSVTLFITDNNGCENSLFQSDLIQIIPNPTAKFAVSQNISCFDTATIFFQDQSTGNSALSYLYYFGDGSQSNQANPSHFYNGYNNYSVALKITDNYGCSDSINKQNLVKLQPIDVHFETINDSLCRNQDLEINNLSVGATSYKWIFGDGEVSTKQDPKKTYTKGGSYNIQLIGSLSNYCYDTATMDIWVDTVKADFTFDKDYGCELPTQIAYTNLSEGANQYFWKFGNGLVSVEKNPTLSFNMTPLLFMNYSETYSDTLIATSDFGCIDTLYLTDNITITLPKISFTPNDTSPDKTLLVGCAPIALNFKNKSISTNPEESFTNYYWDFGNGQTSTQENPQMTYTNPGDYEVTLRVTNSSNCVNSFTSTVLAGTPQTADFTISSDFSICGSLPVVFVNQSTNDNLVDDWLWQFSDNQISRIKNPSHTFTDTGYVGATLQVFYNGCPSEPITKDSISFVNGPAGSMTFLYDCNTPLTYDFLSEIKGADSIFWDFGDFTYDSTQNIQPTHSYSQTGNYQVKLLSKNTDSQCELPLSLHMAPRIINSRFTLDNKILCLNDSLFLDGSLSQDQTFFWQNQTGGYFYWTFDQDSSKLVAGTTHHQFSETGMHEINLMVKDINGCTDDTTISIEVLKPQAQFSMDTNQGCTPVYINLTNSSVSDTLFSSWSWFVDNALISTEKEPTIQISDTGKHTLQLVAEDAIGCKDTATLTEGIFTSRPQPAIQLPALLNCQYDSLAFKNLSKGNLVSTLWSFGDGFQDTSFNTLHAYTDTGYFHLQLYLQDSLGCDTTYTHTDSIYIEALPQANFSFEITNPKCYPALVKFKDSSVGNIKAWSWNFGDNTAINGLQNPLHTYQVPGLFDISLDVSTFIGCKNSKIAYNGVKINGPYALINTPDSVCIHEPNWFKIDDTLNIFSLEWLFTDGAHTTIDSILHAFDAFGWHDFNLILRSDSLHTCDKLLSDSTLVPLLVADFTLSDTIGCEPLTIEATNLSTGNVWQDWLIDNQSISQEINSSFTLQESGTNQIKLRVSNALNCIDSTIRQILVNPLPTISLANDTAICYNDTISLWARGGELYHWNPGQRILNDNQDTATVFPKESTFYEVVVTDSNGCINSDSIEVQVQQIPVVHILNEDTTLIIGETLDMEGAITFAHDYYWWPEAGLDCPTCLSTTAQPRETQMYHLTATDDLGCFTITDSIPISVDIKFSVAMPSAFTPNNDGVNDLIFVRGWGIESLISFQIYNKFGLKVFETNDLEQGWDGKYQGNLLTPDIFYYKVEALSLDGKTRTTSGEIYLLK